VRGGRLQPGAIDSHGDHRIAMAGAVAALAIEGETRVRGWRAVATSYPEFTRDLAALTGDGA
jgi:3-phosphoshikimate 1-carboxyvinyltransferase